MKKLVAIIALVAILTLSLTGCNKTLIDTHYSFHYAILQYHDGEEIIKISTWTDFDDCDQIQFTSVDGITYLVHSSDVFLVTELP